MGGDTPAKKTAEDESSSDGEPDVDEEMADEDDSGSDSDSGSSSEEEDDDDEEEEEVVAPPKAAKTAAMKKKPAAKKRVLVDSSDSEEDEDEDEEEDAPAPVPTPAAKTTTKNKKKVVVPPAAPKKRQQAEKKKKRSIAEAAGATSDEEDEEGSADDDEEEEGNADADAAPSDKQEAVDADHAEDVIKDVHRASAVYVVRVGDHEIRTAAAQRDDLRYGDDPNAKTVLDHEDPYLKDTVMLAMPADVAVSVGIEDGVRKARGLSRNPRIENTRRLVDVGIRRSGTMLFPLAYVFMWIRSLEAVPEEDIARVEAALADPSMYEEVTKGAMQHLGPAKVSRVVTTASKSKSGKKKGEAADAHRRRHHTKKRKGGASRDDDTADAGVAPPYKRHRGEGSGDDLMVFLNVLGRCLVQSTQQFVTEDA